MFRSSSEFSSSPFKEEEEEQKKNKIAMLAFVLLFSLGLIAPVLCQTAPTPSTCNEMKTVTAANSFIFKSAGVIPRRVAGKCSVEYKVGYNIFSIL